MKTAPILEEKSRFKKERKIGMSVHHNRGEIITEKNPTDGIVYWQSDGERILYHMLIHDPNCIHIESQPVKIRNFDPESPPYVPDTWAEFINGTEYIFDVKDESFFNSLTKHPEKAKAWGERVKCVEMYCKENGLNYIIVLKEDLKGSERWENIQFFMKDKDLASSFLGELKPLIDEALREKESLSISELNTLVTSKASCEKGDSVNVINNLIYQDYFLLNFETKIENTTILRLRGNRVTRLLPLYKYILKRKDNIKKKQDIVESNVPKFTRDERDIKDFLGLDDATKENILNDLEALKIFYRVPAPSTDEIKEHAQKHRMDYTTLYRKKKRFDDAGGWDARGWEALIPRHDQKGRKVQFPPEMDELILNCVNDYLNNQTKKSMRGAHRYFEMECLRRGIKKGDYPAKDAFFDRIKLIQEPEMLELVHGWKARRDEFDPLVYENPFGLFPLHAVEIDHTPLLWVVDSKDREPIGVVWLTLAIDIFSRMIYGYYLSFDTPCRISIAECFMVGIEPKDDILKKFNLKKLWDIRGLPSILIMDNGSDFVSKEVKMFCKLHGITPIWNPKGKPKWKPHVERVFRTIKENFIRDSGIGGYIPPIKERRVYNKKPETKADHTIDEFEALFVKWVVEVYNQKIHSGIKGSSGEAISPAEKYKQGITEVNGRMVGQPRTPDDWDQLKYQLLPSDTRTLHRYGIHIHNRKYQADILTELRSKVENKGKEFLIRYDPRDVSKVWLWIPGDRHHPIPMIPAQKRELGLNNGEKISLRDLNLFNRLEKSGEVIVDHEIITAEIELQEMIKGKKETTKNKRLESRARKRQEKSAYNESKAVTSRENAVKEKNDDDDGLTKENVKLVPSKKQLVKHSNEKFDESWKQPVIIKTIKIPEKKSNPFANKVINIKFRDEQHEK